MQNYRENGNQCQKNKYVYSSYGQSPEFKVFENSTQVILPRLDMAAEFNSKQADLTAEEEKLLKYIKSTQGISRIDSEKYMGIGKTKATNLINGLLDKDVVIKIGIGKNTKYKYKQRVF